MAARGAAAALVGALAFGSVGMSYVAAAPAGCANESIDGVEAESQSRFVSLLNDLRRSRGQSTLAVHDGIIGPSIEWSQHMSGQNRLYHARDTGAGDGVEPHQDYVRVVGDVVPNWTRVAENVGVSSVGTWCTTDELRSTVLSATGGLHDAFVKSSGHFANMVGDFNQVGIGVHVDSDQLWVTVRFAKGDAPAPAKTYSKEQTEAAARYIDAVYQLFLGRPASSGDISRWTSAVASGNRGALTNSLSVSDEWAGSRVSALYQTVLGRDAEAAGRANWVKAIAGGMQLETVATGIYGSQERFNASGATHTGFVDGLYQDILGRKADAGGRSHWVGMLDRRTMDRAQVAAGFYGSIESRLDRVRRLYGDVLDRAPDQAGLDHWAGRLSSLGDVVLAGTLASSEEFYLRATR